MIVKGQKINDRYEIIRSIGEGGMANVYLALDTILNRRVAVKILRGDLASDEKFVRRFQREAISASSLSHPNIVEMYDVGEDNGEYFIVMEYVEGKSLKSLIKKRGGLTLAEAIDIMLQLTDGIACAHNSYIIHRDIKPQNIIILDDGRVKITDFGIAQALKSQELTQTNSVMGSVHYLPPEQANGTGTTIKSDIYSLGIVMFEILTGKVPFKGENAVEIAIKQMRDPMPSIRDYKEDIPQSIENIILKATAKNPKNRYDSVLEMQEDIKTALSVDRRDEKKIEFLYPEFEKEEEKETLSREQKNADRIEKEENDFQDLKEKKSNKVLWVIGIIIAVIVLAMVSILVILPMTKRVPNVTIPDVTDVSLNQAIKELEDLGLVVETKVIEEYDDEIEEGNVIKTNPSFGRDVKKGTSITITVSLGLEGFMSESYIGKKYSDEKVRLETKEVTVKTEEKEFTKKEDIIKLLEEKGVKVDSEISDIDIQNMILDQDIEVGKELKKGDTVTFTKAKLVVVYPDFTDGTWKIEDIRDFCKKNNLVLKEKTITTTDHPDGTIYSQDRAPESKVVAKMQLTITITKKPEEKPSTSTPENNPETDKPQTDTTTPNATKPDTTTTTKPDTTTGDA